MIGLVPWVVNKFVGEENEEPNTQFEANPQDVCAGAEKKDSISPGMLQEMSNNPGETLVFVDADGVVNVGIRDTSGQSPLLLCQTNLERSKQVAGRNMSGLAAIINHVASSDIGHGDNGSYAMLATAPGSYDISPILAGRLGRIIDAAGPRCTLVLSSSWRKPSHRPRVVALEAAISESCGRSLTFTEKTGPGGDHPEKRFHLIGNFVSDYSERRREEGDDSPLRVLVLDDFAATHPKRWNMEEVTSVSSWEEAMRQRSACPQNTFVKLVHTYEEWSTDSGEHVQIGCGLTMKKVREAERFLAGNPNEN
mmetsp:Transcript_115812/g.201054  ORF Transcript_115812/g.201054 Transcript_115812/m.201054 type:complete len:309 (-) Transcript_115812:134-1060(-)